MADRSSKIRQKIIDWYDHSGRILPWRITTNAWHIFASEFMLQQTQVGRVVPKYEEFVRRWPRPSDFARETLGSVLRFWSGLGYNRRAKHLWQAARLMGEQFGDVVPLDEKLLRTLPGVGEYTARAVLSFVANKNVVCVDTNIRRIFLRLFWDGEFSIKFPTNDQLTRMLNALLPKKRSRLWHNALMDFGSLVCTSRDPRCDFCPLLTTCKSGKKFIAGAFKTQKLYHPQERFSGSRREVRGAILKMLAMDSAGKASPRALALMSKKFPAHNVPAVIQEMANEGLLVTKDTHIALPD